MASTGDEELEALVELGNDVLQRQLHISQEQNAKARILMVLSGGVLAVAVAMGGFVAGRPLAPFLGILELGVFGLLVLFGFAFLSALAAFWLFAGSLVGGKKSQPYELQLGWHPDTLVQAARNGDTLMDVRLSTLGGLQDWILKNMTTLEMVTRMLRTGRWFLISAGCFLSAALIYALGAIVS